MYLIRPVVSTDLTKYSYPNLTNLIRQPTPDRCFHPPDNPASNNFFFWGLTKSSETTSPVKYTSSHMRSFTKSLETITTLTFWLVLSSFENKSVRLDYFCRCNAWHQESHPRCQDVGPWATERTTSSGTSPSW